MLTLAQVKFNTVPVMEDYAKQIQNEFRKQQEFIHHDNEESPIVNIGPQGSKITKVVSWYSRSSDNNTRLIFGNDFLTIETIEYPGYEKFIPTFLSGLDIVQKITDVSHMTRAGFRYINRIESDGKKSLNYYLNEQLLGFKMDDIAKEKALSRTEAIADTHEGNIRVHCMQLYREREPTVNLLLPPELVTKLEVKPLTTPESQLYAFLDIDHFKDYGREPIKFNLEEISSKLDRLHQIGYEAFISGSTGQARKEWEE